MSDMLSMTYNLLKHALRELKRNLMQREELHIELPGK